ncbi:MAG: acyl carrier protein [Nitrospiraceae bacterium]
MADPHTDDFVKQEVRRFLATELRVDVDDPDFADDVNLFDSGFLDSLGFATLITHLEGRYEIRFDPQELFAEDMMTLSGLVQILNSRRKSQRLSATDLSRKDGVPGTE